MPKKKRKKKKAPTPKISEPLGFLGAGNMAEALIRGLIQSQTLPATRIIAADRERQRLDFLKKKYKIKTASSNIDLISRAKTIVLAVKPQNVEELAGELKGSFQKEHLIISLAAGISTYVLRQVFGEAPRIIRVMPNTPALVGYGASVLFLGKNCKKSDISLAKKLFEAVGMVKTIHNENLMDTVTGLSGSGPAYVFLFMEAMTEAGIQGGLDEQTARNLSVQTVLGAAQLAKETGKAPKELRRQVSSPGGTTIEGVKALEEGLFPQSIQKAVSAATARSKRLSKIY